MRVRSFSVAVGKEGKLRKARESLQINCGRVDSVCLFWFSRASYLLPPSSMASKKVSSNIAYRIVGYFTPHTKDKQKKERADKAHARKKKFSLRSGAGATSRLRLVFYLLLKYFIYPNEEMAQQRSPRKSLQLNRANTPINVDGPMQDVNVSLSFLLLFMPTLRARAHWSHLSHALC